MSVPPMSDNASWVGSVRKLVSDSRRGVGIDIREGGNRVSVRPGMGVGMDWTRRCRASSDGTFPVYIFNQKIQFERRNK